MIRLYRQNIAGIAACLFLGVAPLAARAEVSVSNLKALSRSGQIFLTWQEAATAPGTTFNVYRSAQPITAANLKQATLIGHHIEPHSARDWWQDPASFDNKLASGTPTGFQIETGAPALAPDGGLFVHTVGATEGPAYFAVTAVDEKGNENLEIAAGANALQQAVTGQVMPPQAIWIGDGAPPVRGAGQGKKLIMVLHGRGGGKTAGPGAQKVNWLAFGDGKQGWREGLSAKFQVDILGDTVRIIPSDRTWTLRPVMESKDARDHCVAVNTWWYGYNSKIYETTLTPQKVVPNYSEERLLWMIRWVQDYYGTDPNKTYLNGGSMGGSGAVSLSMHHPEVFAATVATVPIVAYTTRGGGRGSLGRLDGVAGPVDETTVDQAGRLLLDQMNGEIQAGRVKADLPYFFIVNGRTDLSIPWDNNPFFYRAMDAARQGLSVYWANTAHPDTMPKAPDDVRAWEKRLDDFALNKSFLVFSKSSDNRNPGNGDPTDGDIVGWFNRGLSWKDIVDTPQEYSVTVLADYPDIKLPIHVDVTPRRLQQFKVKPGDSVKVNIADKTQEVRADTNGLLTIPAVEISEKTGTRIQLTR